MRFFSDSFVIDSQREVTKEGYLLAKNCKMAKTGVLQYHHSEIGDIDGMPEDRRGTVIKVHRAASPLLDEETINSFKSKPVTVLHPDELLSAETAKNELVGMTRDNLRSDGKFIIGDILIMDKDAIELIGEGTKELSLGYSADIIWCPGTSEDGDYDAIMKNYSGNHVAIVPNGRCGSECKITDSKTNPNKKGNTAMDEDIVIAGVTHKVNKAVAKHVKDMEMEQEQAEKKDGDYEKKMEDMHAEKEKLEGKLDGLKADMEEMKKHKVGDADISDLVSARVELERKAQSIIGDSASFKGQTDRQVKVSAVKARNGMEIADSKHDEYVNAMFDHVCIEVKASETKTIADAATELSYSDKVRQKHLDNQNTRA